MKNGPPLLSWSKKWIESLTKLKINFVTGPRPTVVLKYHLPLKWSWASFQVWTWKNLATLDKKITKDYEDQKISRTNVKSILYQATWAPIIIINCQELKLKYVSIHEFYQYRSREGRKKGWKVEDQLYITRWDAYKPTHFSKPLKINFGICSAFLNSTT